MNNVKVSTCAAEWSAQIVNTEMISIGMMENSEMGTTPLNIHHNSSVTDIEMQSKSTYMINFV